MEDAARAALPPPLPPLPAAVPEEGGEEAEAPPEAPEPPKIEISDADLLQVSLAPLTPMLQAYLLEQPQSAHFKRRHGKWGRHGWQSLRHCSKDGHDDTQLRGHAGLLDALISSYANAGGHLGRQVALL